MTADGLRIPATLAWRLTMRDQMLVAMGLCPGDQMLVAYFHIKRPPDQIAVTAVPTEKTFVLTAVLVVPTEKTFVLMAVLVVPKEKTFVLRAVLVVPKEKDILGAGKGAASALVSGTGTRDVRRDGVGVLLLLRARALGVAGTALGVDGISIRGASIGGGRRCRQRLTRRVL